MKEKENDDDERKMHTSNRQMLFAFTWWNCTNTFEILEEEKKTMFSSIDI